jgi:hypothetical protein
MSVAEKVEKAPRKGTNRKRYLNHYMNKPILVINKKESKMKENNDERKVQKVKFNLGYFSLYIVVMIIIGLHIFGVMLSYFAIESLLVFILLMCSVETEIEVEIN